MTSFVNQTFESFYDKPGSCFADLEFRHCQFEGCGISPHRKVKKRSTFRNIRLLGCAQLGCSVFGGVFEDCVVEDFDVNDQLMIVSGAVFRHCVLRGEIGSVKFHPEAMPLTATVEEEQAYSVANAAYYMTVDWALDISKAKFEDSEFRGVPAHLIRRDPETQCVITLGGLKAIKKLPKLIHPYWPFIFGDLVRDGVETRVVAAPLQQKNSKDMVKDIKVLRKAGIALPD